MVMVKWYEAQEVVVVVGGGGGCKKLPFTAQTLNRV